MSKKPVDVPALPLSDTTAIPFEPAPAVVPDAAAARRRRRLMQRRLQKGLHVVGGVFSIILLYASVCQQSVQSRQQEVSKEAVASYVNQHPGYRLFLYDVLPARRNAPGYVPSNAAAHESLFRDAALTKTPCERAVAAQAAWREDAAARAVPVNGWARLLMPIPTPALKRPPAAPAYCEQELAALKPPPPPPSPFHW